MEGVAVPKDNTLPYNQITQLLGSVPLFQQAEAHYLERLARTVQRIYAERKKILFKQGDACDGFHVIVYGRIKMSLVAWNGVDKPIQLMGPGECFGDITMFNEQPYFLNVQTLEDSLLLYIPRQSIIELIEHDSRFALRMLASLAVRVRGMVDDIESFSLQPPAARLVTYLMRLLPSNCMKTARIELTLNKNIVAAHLNLTPETLSRYFKELSQAGLVSVHGRTVQVHDVDALGHYLDEQSKARRLSCPRTD